MGAKNRLESQRWGHYTVSRRQAREHTVEIMNRLHWSRAVRDAVLAANDVLRARSAALVRAGGDAPLEHRLRKVDRLVAVRAQHLEPVVFEGRGRREAPPYDRNVFLRAVDQLDVLRGVGRRDEVQLAAAGGQRQQHQRAADRDASLLACSDDRMVEHLLWWRTMHGGIERIVGTGGAKTQARTMLGNYAISKRVGTRPPAIVPTKLGNYNQNVADGLSCHLGNLSERWLRVGKRSEG